MAGRLLVVANVDAGSAAALDEALAVLGPADVVRTGGPDELDAVLDRAGVDRAGVDGARVDGAGVDRAGNRVVVVAGGDGTLHAVVAALHRRDGLRGVTLGLVPLGTGNDFARGAGIPLEPAAAARALLDGRPARVDLLLDDTGGVVVNNVHIGVGAEASRQAQPWKRRLGPVGYVVGALLAGLTPPTLRLRVTVDDAVVSDRATLQVAIGNAPYVGGGTEITPGADPADGRVDVMVSAAVGPLARLAYAVRLRRGEHHRRDDVIRARGHTVTVAGDAFHASADGEIHGPLRHRTWTVRPAALTIMLPAQGERP